MTTTTNNQFCVRWNGHLNSFGVSFSQLLTDQRFVDVTLACDGQQLHCHRLVLAACSAYFENLLSENPCKHPVIILPREIKLWTIQALVAFMYMGEVNVSQDGLPEFLKCGETLRIRGICDHIIRNEAMTTTTPVETTSSIIQEPLTNTMDPELAALTAGIPATTKITKITKLQPDNQHSTILPTLTTTTPIMSPELVLNEATSKIAAIKTSTNNNITVYNMSTTTVAQLLEKSVSHFGIPAISATITPNRTEAPAVTIKNVLPKIVQFCSPHINGPTVIAATITTPTSKEASDVSIQATAPQITQSTTPASTSTIIAIQATQLDNCIYVEQISDNSSEVLVLDDSDTEMNSTDNVTIRQDSSIVEQEPPLHRFMARKGIVRRRDSESTEVDIM